MAETTSSDDERTAFQGVYSVLKSELLNDPGFEWTDHSRQWVDRMLDYHLRGGKLDGCMSVIDSYKLLKGGEDGLLGEDEFFLASALGWCIEWLQAFFNILDGVIDGQDDDARSCWSRVPQVSSVGLIDVMIRTHINKILKSHFRVKAYYVDLLDLFSEVDFETASGRVIQFITNAETGNDLSKYSSSLYHRTLQYNKTAYGSFYLPVACALLMAGESLDNHVSVKNVLIDMGIYFQAETGKDREDFKCSWLVVTALEHCNEEQKKTLIDHYGKKDPADVAIIKALYNELNLQSVFDEYQSKTYDKLRSSIEAHPSKAVQAVLMSFLDKTFNKRQT